MIISLLSSFLLNKLNFKNQLIIKKFKNFLYYNIFFYEKK